MFKYRRMRYSSNRLRAALHTDYEEKETIGTRETWDCKRSYFAPHGKINRLFLFYAMNCSFNGKYYIYI